MLQYPILPCRALNKFHGRRKKGRKEKYLGKGEVCSVGSREKYDLLQTEVYALSSIFNSLISPLLLFMSLNNCYDFVDIFKFAVNHGIISKCLYMLCSNLNAFSSFSFPDAVLRYPASIKRIPFLF